MFWLAKIKYHLVSIIQMLVYKLLYGKRVTFGKRVSFRKGFSLAVLGKGTIHIGDHVFFNHYCSLYAMQQITIGEGTIFGENVKVYDHNHQYADETLPIKAQGYTSAAITIGRHCWIGSNVVILKGVTIGNNCVIGAGCIIYKSIPDNMVVRNKQALMIDAKK